MINFLKKLPLFKDVYRQGGIDSFPLAQKDILETMRDDLDKQANELAKQKLNDLLSIVDAHKIVTLDKQHGIIFIGGIKAESDRLANLRSEAEFFLESDLWGLLYETPKELASRAMFVNGETLADLHKGKSMLYTLATQKNILETLKGYIDKSKLSTK